MNRFLSITMIFFLLSVCTFAQSEAKRLERLSGLAKVWGAVKFFHPYLAYKEIDWDKALVEAIPRVNESKTPTEYAAAVNSMLAVLGDAQTRALIRAGESNSANESTTQGNRDPIRLENGILFYDALGSARAAMANPGKAGEFTENYQKLLPQAKASVIDGRTNGESNEYALYILQEQLTGILSATLNGQITLGTLRYRIHNGYPPQNGSTSGGYYSGIITDTPQTLGGPQTKTSNPLPTVVIVDATSPFAEIFSGLQAANKALIVSESSDISAKPYTLDLEDGVQVEVRTREIVAPDGTVGFTPDAVAPIGEALSSAQKIVADDKFISARRRVPSTPVSQISPKDRPYPEMSFPSKEYRLLALSRFWNVINYFFPYKDLIGTEWNTVLPKYILKLEASKDAADYQMTLREMVAETHDSHVGLVNANAINEKLGVFLPPIMVRFIENQTVISKVLDEKIQVRTGDVILTIDGEDVGNRREFFSRLFSASTPQALMRNVHYSILRGQKDSSAKLTVRDADGKIRTVEVVRSLNRNDPKFEAAEKRSTPVYNVLPSGFGYVDLDRLPASDVYKMFDALKNTPGIIFDMRGYPKGTAWAIAPRLSDKRQPIAALFSRPIVTGNSVDDQNFGGGGPQFTFGQPIPPRTGDVYRGKIVMLIDEYAQSQSEHTALFFETARPDIAFIGTPTAGANGDVTYMVLPGNLVVSFSGHNVRHADGRQLQRMGIQPTVRVAPTIKGIASGEDEVLDAAVKYLEKNR